MARRDIPGADNADSPVGDSADSLATRKRCGTKKNLGVGCVRKMGWRSLTIFVELKHQNKGFPSILSNDEWKIMDVDCPKYVA